MGCWVHITGGDVVFQAENGKTEERGTSTKVRRFVEEEVVDGQECFLAFVVQSAHLMFHGSHFTHCFMADAKNTTELKEYLKLAFLGKPFP